MAAIQWSGGKMHGATEAKASMMHDDKDMRMIHSHTNPDIDVSKTPGNFSYRGLSYYAKCKRYDEIQSEIKIKRKSTGKNTNVTLQKLEAAIPAGMQDGERYDPDLVRAWVNDVGKILENEFGDLLIDIDCHVDEVHLYIDPRKDKDDPNRYAWSRIHIHAAVVPGVWEIVKDKEGNPVLGDDGKPLKELVLNGYKFSNKRNIIRLNQRIQDMTKEKYGMDFMTGKGRGQKHQTVEDLKRWTAETMREEGLQMVLDRQDLEEAQREIENLRQQAQQRLAEAEEHAAAIAAKSETAAETYLLKARANAHKEAKKITDGAKAEADKIRRDADVRTEELRHMLILQTQAALSQQRALLDLEREELDRQYDEREADLAEARESVITNMEKNRNERASIAYSRKLLEEDRQELDRKWAAYDTLDKSAQQMYSKAKEAERTATARMRDLDDREKMLANHEKQLEPMVSAYSVLQLMFRHERDLHNTANAGSIKQTLALLRQEYNNKTDPWLQRVIDAQTQARVQNREQARIPAERRLPSIQMSMDQQ